MPRLKRRWFAALICFSLFGLSGTTGAQTTDEEHLRALAAEFFAAYSKKDINSFAKFWGEKSPELAARKRAMEKLFADSEKIEVKDVAVRKLSVEGDKAKLRVEVEINATDAKTGKLAAGFGKMYRAMEIVKQADGWKVWREAAAEEELADAIIAANSEQERNALMAAEPELVNSRLLRSIFERGVRLRVAGKYDEALNVYSLLRGMAERSGDKGSLASALNAAAVVYDLRGDHALALKLFQESLTIREALGDKLLIAASLLNVGGAYRWLGDYDKALDYYRQSAELAKALGDELLVSRAFNNSGIIYDLRGDYISAIQAYQKSLELKRKRGDKIGIAQTLNNLAIIYKVQGNYDLALKLHQESLSLRQAAGDKSGVSESLLNIGNIYSRQGNDDAALDYYRKSLQMSEEIGEKNRAVLTLNNIGDIHRDRREYAEALENIRKSLEISKSLENKEYFAYTLEHLASVNIVQGDYALARDTAEQAIAIARQVGLLDALHEMHTIAGKAQFALKQYGEARRSFDDAINIIETMRSRVAGGEQEQQSFFEERVSPYYAMVELLIAQNHLSDALAYAERAKGRALLDVLRSGRVNVTKAMTAGEQEQERDLVREIVTLNSQISREGLPASDRLASLKARLEKARLNYEAFQTNLYAAHPRLKAQRVQTPPLSLVETSDMLDAKTALLEYVIAEEKAFLLVVTAGPTTPKRLPEPVLKVYELNIKRKDLAERVELFRQRLANRDRDFHEPASQLYDLLLKPARAQLQGKTMLVVVPDDALWNLPFQALQPAASRYLVEDSAISYAPSLTVLREMMSARRKEVNAREASRKLLALGNPALGNQIMNRVKSAPMDEILEPLPEAERQVKTLGQLYGTARSRVYVGREAREDLLKSEAGKYEILHLATHGMLNDASPMYSYVLLSQTEGGGNEDGMLEAWEMMKLDLKAELVVLSACDTARGRVGAGEGVIGLTWALFVAGSPTTVVSQWKVESASTTELMLEFHRNLKSARMTKAEALRQAELKLLRNKQYQHPFFWAGFVVMGDGF